MSKPPIFSVPPTGNNAQQYMHRARMFRAAAMNLSDYVNGETNWPKYAPLTHAIELALKAFVDHFRNDPNTSGRRLANHDLRGWYQLAVQYGLPNNRAAYRRAQ